MGNILCCIKPRSEDGKVEKKKRGSEKYYDYADTSNKNNKKGKPYKTIYSCSPFRPFYSNKKFQKENSNFDSQNQYFKLNYFEIKNKFLYK